jgi:hypothetical protein
VGGPAAKQEAAEPAEDGHTHESACLNCGTALVGEHCHACGQRAHVHRTLGAFSHDLLHGVLHFEGKTWRTLPMLAWRPGELTRRYIDGERARFVSPLALFLFAVFLMFAVFNSVGGDTVAAPAGFSSGFDDEIATAEDRLRFFEQTRAQRAASGQPTGWLDQQIRTGREHISTLRRIEQSAAFSKSELTVGDGTPEWLKPAVDKFIKNPDLILYKLQSNAYKYSWALIPISLPFLWLLFLHKRRYRQRYGAYHHIVFITYSIAFMTLVAILLVLVRAAGVEGAWLLRALAVIAPVHMFLQLRRAYELTIFGALWRTVALSISAAAAGVAFILLLLGLGLLG